MKLIKRYGAPDQNQIGSVNDLYLDLDTNEVYRCTKITTNGEELGGSTVYASTCGNTEYTWEAVGGSGGGNVVLAEMQQITYTENENGSKEAYVIPSNFEEFSDDKMYLVHYNGSIVGFTSTSKLMVAESNKIDINTVVWDEIGPTVYLYMQIPQWNAKDEVKITVDNTENTPRYRIYVAEPDEYYFKDTATIAIERIVSSIE